MEQVFDQVSRLLKNHTATRLRNLGIRTYKVLPLSTRSGLMEFVQDTVPLHMWVMPAHEKYYPHDYKPDKCRKDISACQQDSLQTRVKVWQKCAENFHPVLRYFLLEHFEDPDEWFERRLAYTRSTAAISILGHVLGLGDRHCHNILLDKKSGEVIHIDLGVSFEAGRVLPVPEVVPFRLTRDLVDAMGYTKTEGVFRRCCEFTMDTLREERESIMTLLNVLRYDPLVNWSVTPTKAKRMQEGQETNAQNAARAGTVGPSGTPAPSGTVVPVVAVDPEAQESNKKREEQAGEAGRALSVVEKKLSKTLSTKATVNELIQQATDERNLAVLYMGWASYA
jgi:ataxia telangiectasia mutated family protein